MKVFLRTSFNSGTIYTRVPFYTILTLHPTVFDWTEEWSGSQFQSLLGREVSKEGRRMVLSAEESGSVTSTKSIKLSLQDSRFSDLSYYNTVTPDW